MLCITKTPELPAKELAKACYRYMFDECNSLTIAPELPATELKDYCYYCMFYECQNLKQATKVLPAQELAKDCYHSMFSCCPALISAPEMHVTSLAENSCWWMFSESGALKIKENDQGGHKIFTCPQVIPNNAVSGMFYKCFDDEGYFTGNPTPGNTYYWCE